MEMPCSEPEKGKCLLQDQKIWKCLEFETKKMSCSRSKKSCSRPQKIGNVHRP